MHILDKIVLHKRGEVQAAKEQVSISQLEGYEHFDRICNSYVDAIADAQSSGVIAEFKRKSPSKSDINLTADLLEVTKGYQFAGANAISILTDEHFFGGHINFLKQVRASLPKMPLLRKEFIIDEYQVIEAKAYGADIILLICEILTAEEVTRFSKLARSLGMEVLLELHAEDQLIKYDEHVTIVGVNNRDLTTFEVDYDRSKKLFDQLPSDIPKVSESGLSDTDTLVMLYEYGFRGFLIGEQFMKQVTPGQACTQFISDYMTKRSAHDS